MADDPSNKHQDAMAGPPEAGRRSGQDRRHHEAPGMPDERRSGAERRGDDRRGPHQEVRPHRVLDFRALIEDWLDKNCEGDWRIGNNPRDGLDPTFRVHFDNPRDKARFNAAMRKLIQKSSDA